MMLSAKNTQTDLRFDSFYGAGDAKIMRMRSLDHEVFVLLEIPKNFTPLNS